MTDDGNDPVRNAIAGVYAQVGAPGWAAPNLDGLADVLRDLSWLPEGEVVIGVPGLEGRDGIRLREVLAAAARETKGGVHPVVLD